MSIYINVVPYDFQRSETMIQVGIDRLKQVYYNNNDFSICSAMQMISKYNLKQ